MHTVLHKTASKSIVKYKVSNTILNNKQIQQAKKIKGTARHEDQEKMKTKNENLIRKALTQNVETHDYITRATEMEIQSVCKN